MPLESYNFNFNGSQQMLSAATSNGFNVNNNNNTRINNQQMLSAETSTGFKNKQSLSVNEVRSNGDLYETTSTLFRQFKNEKFGNEPINS